MQTLEEQHEWLAKEMPDFYREQVRKGAILESARQIELGKLDLEGFHKFLMNRSVAWAVGIYPEHATRSIRAVDLRLREEFEEMQPFKSEKEVAAARKALGDKASLIQLEEYDGLYTRETRQEGALMSTGNLEYKVKAAERIIDGAAHFLVTDVKGYYGFLKYYIEEVGRIAPDKANAFLLGNGIIVPVEKRKFRSPIIADTQYSTKQKDGEYQVVPIEFYNVESDKSVKYTLKTTSRQVGDSIYMRTRPVLRKKQ